jgi:hypothetical protein
MFNFQSILSFKGAALVALSLFSVVESAPPPAEDSGYLTPEKSGDGGGWVTIWGAMPQLTEPGNLPPEGFVSW